MLAESQFSVHFPVKDRVADVDLSVVTVDEAIVAAREGFALLHTSTVPTRQVGSDASSLRRRDDSAPTWNSRRGGGGGASAPGVGRASNEIRIGGSRLLCSLPEDADAAAKFVAVREQHADVEPASFG